MLPRQQHSALVVTQSQQTAPHTRQVSGDVAYAPPPFVLLTLTRLPYSYKCQIRHTLTLPTLGK
ncbi:hypothetical protein E2C01_075617 [Portunus trituberculatus]|uniref:Uncharacterized protein n=1 Tax=Portunus trituberculatus TaxID=210409 RepID=A0A5B7IHI6_PORTR|nr:hypothetical protein [Portunus trituberculatus]